MAATDGKIDDDTVISGPFDQTPRDRLKPGGEQLDGGLRSGRRRDDAPSRRAQPGDSYNIVFSAEVLCGFCSPTRFETVLAANRKVGQGVSYVAPLTTPRPLHR